MFPIVWFLFHPMDTPSDKKCIITTFKTIIHFYFKRRLFLFLSYRKGFLIDIQWEVWHHYKQEKEFSFKVRNTFYLVGHILKILVVDELFKKYSLKCHICFGNTLRPVFMFITDNLMTDFALFYECVNIYCLGS